MIVFDKTQFETVLTDQENIVVGNETENEQPMKANSGLGILKQLRWSS